VGARAVWRLIKSCAPTRYREVVLTRSNEDVIILTWKI
jgi:hypothetical protein